MEDKSAAIPSHFDLRALAWGMVILSAVFAAFRVSAVFGGLTLGWISLLLWSMVCGRMERIHRDTPPMSSPRRRWSFGLRTLLVLVALASVPLGLVGYSLNWIRQRHNFISSKRGYPVSLAAPSRPPARCPLVLRPFGEQGWDYIQVERADNADTAMRLFPEAIIYAPSDDAMGWTVLNPPDDGRLPK